MGLLEIFVGWLESKTQEQDERTKLIMQEIFELHHFGKELKSEEEAKTHEDILLAEPHNVLSRSLLLSYYTSVLFRRANEYEVAHQQYFRHIQWLVKNEPASKLHEKGELAEHFFTESEFKNIVELWEEQVSKHPKNTKVLKNFAGYIWLVDEEKALELYKECQRLEPREPEWCYDISRLLEGKEAIYWAEEWLSRCKWKHSSSAVQHLAYLHLEEGNFNKARGYAFRLKFGKADSDEVHNAEIILGMVALNEKKLSRAKRHLKKSAEVKTSPVLGSFGPQMMLAHALLKAGEKQAVLDYLTACQKFSTSIRIKFGFLKEDIEQGRTPEDWLTKFENLKRECEDEDCEPSCADYQDDSDEKLSK